MTYFLELHKAACRKPDDLFIELCTAGRRLSYLEVRNRIAAGSRLLRERGIGPGNVVLIFAQHGLGMLQAFFGCQVLGAIPSFMPPPTSRQPLQLWKSNHLTLLMHIRPTLLVYEDEYVSHIRSLKFDRVLPTSELESAGYVEEVDFNKYTQTDSIAFLQHSSGTTGLKKGVTVTFGQLEHQIRAYASVLGIQSGDHIVSWLPLYHDMGLVAATLMPFCLGIPMSVIHTMRWLEQPSSYFDMLSARPNSYSWLPNFAFSHLARRCVVSPHTELSRVKGIISCSEPCKADVLEEFKKKFARYGLPDHALQVCYAMAEYVFGVTQTDMSGSPRFVTVNAQKFDQEHVAVPSNTGRTFVSVGAPLPGASVRIGAVDRVREGQVDEIYVSGPSLCAGYYGNPELTRRKFSDGWYKTGDYGFILDGELFITGRADDLIIVRGRNMYAHDVEALAANTGYIKPGRAVAFGVYDRELGTEKMIIAAEIEQKGLAEEAKVAIGRLVRQAYEVSPSDIVLVPPSTLIKTTSGKISRSENSALYVAQKLVSWAER
jgi:acyl-CoA synthetase (AMP-forming)/AMP-acid ligase II